MRKVEIMSINIGNNNKITNSTITEKIENSYISPKSVQKQTFYEKHPIICGFFISLIAGIILLFSFWDKIVNFLEGVF